MSGRLIPLDASPWLWVENTWALILCVLALLVRAVVRNREYGLDDILLFLASIFAVASFGCIFKALHDGLGVTGHSQTETHWMHLAKLIVDGSCLCFVADGLSKLSTIAMLHRIICRGTIRDNKYVAWFAGTSGLTILWAIFAVAIWASHCSHSYLNQISQRVVCSRGTANLEAIIILSILIELSLFLLSVYLFWGLNMKLHKKITVISIFGMRLPLIVVSIYFLLAFKRYSTRSDASAIIYGSALYWQIGLTGYSILATAIQPLKRAATSFNTHSKMPVGHSGHASRSAQSSKLRSSTKPRQSLLLTRTPSPPPPMIWSSVKAGKRHQYSDSIESHGSQDHIVKKTDVQVTFSDDRHT